MYISMQIVFVYLSQWAHVSNYQKCEMFSSQKKKNIYIYIYEEKEKEKVYLKC